MAKKLVTVLLTLTLIACSSISIYAAEAPVTENNTTNDITNEQLTPEEADGKDAKQSDAQAKREAEEKAKKEAAKKADEKYKNGLAAYIRKVNPNVSRSKSKAMAGHFISKGKKYNLDPKVLMAIAKNESTFYTNAKSPYGYKGLMQTSDALARKFGYKPSSLYEAEVSIDVGARYLRLMKNKFKTYTKSISAYAYGEGTVMSGNYSTKLAKKMLRTRDDITGFLKRNNYV